MLVSGPGFWHCELWWQEVIEYREDESKANGEEQKNTCRGGSEGQP